ncbi:hypothetical protein VNI00_007292 [Paramarasmius palmivorus]|uniref:Uncharacterized protein n=1 Tax=Paramarasmius palmivorus TaxID=297713 RepID=A0AAW0D400_9AGAR
MALRFLYPSPPAFIPDATPTRSMQPAAKQALRSEDYRLANDAQAEIKKGVTIDYLKE